MLIRNLKGTLTVDLPLDHSISTRDVDFLDSRESGGVVPASSREGEPCVALGAFDAYDGSYLSVRVGELDEPVILTWVQMLTGTARLATKVLFDGVQEEIRHSLHVHALFGVTCGLESRMVGWRNIICVQRGTVQLRTFTRQGENPLDSRSFE